MDIWGHKKVVYLWTFWEIWGHFQRFAEIFGKPREIWEILEDLWTFCGHFWVYVFLPPENVSLANTHLSDI